ncbi:MAG: cell division protein FtsQ [Paracoccaceae bacterium]|jgi:cell division protein FtsQ
MQQVSHPKHDPAPSRLSYRIQRLMLTPGVRLLLRIGIPVAVVFAATSGFLANEQRRDALNQFVAEIRSNIQERPEFMVSLMAIDGAGLNLAEDIRQVVPLDFPISSFDMDLEQIRNMIAGLAPVKTASVRIRPGGVLQIDVTERLPVVVWRDRSGIALLDETGTYVDEVLRRTARVDLPLIAGNGADQHVTEALALIAATGPLSDRVRGLVRIGERRWDVVLDRDQRILLPVDNPVRALEHVIALNQARDMLKRDLVVVDMRIAARPTIRMSPEAVKDWWRIREINGSGQ